MTKRIKTLDTRGDYLEHHGVPGQKWGVRRYQNEDGSLTSAGKRRYGEDGPVSDRSRKKYRRDIEKSLNRNEQNYADNVARLYYSDWRRRDMESRIAKRQSRGKDASKLQKRLNKFNEQTRDQDNKFYTASKEGRKEIDRILKLAGDSGFSVTKESHDYRTGVVGPYDTELLVTGNKYYLKDERHD